MALPHAHGKDVAALNHIVSDDAGDGNAADQTNWVRRSTRPVQPKALNEVPTNTNAAHNTNNNNYGARKDPPELINQKPKHRKKNNHKRSNPEGDTVQLFAFNISEENTRDFGGRPKRKLKTVARFDSQTFDSQKNCKVGQGFPCPRCTFICAYDSKRCLECNLPCCYEAGVGVVVLRDRNDLETVPKPKRQRKEVAVLTKNNNGKDKNTTKKAKKAQRRVEGADEIAEEHGAQSARKKSRKSSKKARSKVVAAASAASAPKSPLGHSTTNGSYATGGKIFRGATGKRLPPQEAATHIDSDDDSVDDVADAITPLARGDGRGIGRPIVALFGQRPFMIKQYASLDDARKDLGTSCKTIREKTDYNHAHTYPKKGTRGKFKHYDFRDVDDTQTARRWARELLAVQHDEYSECNTLCEARAYPTWPMHLADSQYKMCMGRRILKLIKGGVVPRKRAGRPLEQPQRDQNDGKGGGKKGRTLSPNHHFTDGTQESTSEDEDEDEAAKKAIVRAIRGKSARSNLTLPAHSAANHLLGEEEGGLEAASAHDLGIPLDNNAGHGFEEDDLDHQRPREEEGGFEAGDANDLGNPLDNNGHGLEEDDLDHFGGPVHEVNEEHDMNMVDELNDDFPLEDHPPGIGADMSAHHNENHDDLVGRLEDSRRALTSVTEEKEEIQAEYKKLLDNSVKTEEKLRGTIAKLRKALREKEAMEVDDAERETSVENNEMQELKNKLAEVSTERDDIAKKLEATSAIQVERDELARKLEKASATLLAKESAGNEYDTEDARKKNESLKQQIGNAESRIADLTEQVSTVSSEKADAVKKLTAVMSDLSELQEMAKSRKVKITQLESTVESLKSERDTANARAAELLKGNNDSEQVLSSLMSKKDEFTSSLEESKMTIKQLKEEKEQASRKAASLEATVEELQGRIEGLSAKLNASKYQTKPTTVKSSNAEQEKVEARQSDVTDREAKYESKIASLEDRMKRQNEEVAASNETITTSNARIADLTSQISKLTAEKDELDTKMEKSTSELCKLQSALETVTTERDAAKAEVQKLTTWIGTDALDSEKEVLMTKIEEMIAGLYSENDESNEHQAPSSPGGNVPSSPIQNIKRQLSEKDKQVSKLSKHKKNLEAYLKQTLGIFQTKYQSATQEYKTQLKEYAQHIQDLEAELSNHKKVSKGDKIDVQDEVLETDVHAELPNESNELVGCQKAHPGKTNGAWKPEH